MPNTRSATKRLRTSHEKAVRNRARQTSVKTHEKKFLAKVKENDTDGAREALKDYFSCLDKVVLAGTVHKNKANRKKARMTAKLKKMA